MDQVTACLPLVLLVLGCALIDPEADQKYNYDEDCRVKAKPANIPS